MPKLSEETERAVRAFAAYVEAKQEDLEFWIKQWRLSGPLNKTKPNKKDEIHTTKIVSHDSEPRG